MQTSGARIAGAAELAVQSVNADSTLLHGRVLEYSWADSGCTAQQGLVAMGELIRLESRIHAVIGPACSSACEVTSYLSGASMPQISYLCTLNGEAGWGWIVGWRVGGEGGRCVGVQ